MRLLCNLFPEGVTSALPFPQRTANAIIIVSLKAAESTRCYGFAAERLQVYPKDVCKCHTGFVCLKDCQVQ